MPFDPNRIQNISASRLDRLEACPSSLAREVEMTAFLVENNLTPPESGEADAGEAMHAIYAGVPFTSHFLGHSPREKNHYENAVDAAADKLGHRWQARDDRDFAIAFLRRRDAIIEDFYREVTELGRGAISEFTVELDTRRIAVELEFPDGQVEVVSGLPDILVKAVTANGLAHVLVLDGKAGRMGEKYDTAEKTSRQLIGLVALAALEADPKHPVDMAQAAILHRGNVRKGVATPLNEFDAPAIESAVQFFARTAYAARTLRQAVRAEKHQPSERLSSRLDDAAATGSHCRYCIAKTCCGKIRTLADETLKKLPEIKGLAGRVAVAVEAHKASLRGEAAAVAPKPAAELAEMWAEASAHLDNLTLIRVAAEEAKHYRVALTRAGRADPGVSFGSPRSTVGFNAAVPIDSESLRRQAELITNRPVSVPEWESAVHDVRLSDMMDALARHLRVPPWRVRDELEAQLGDETPFTVAHDRPKVRKV